MFVHMSAMTRRIRPIRVALPLQATRKLHDSADTYDASKSNVITAKASVDVKAAVNIDKGAVAVKSGSEKGGVVTQEPDGKLAVIPEKGKAGDLTTTISVDKTRDVAAMHACTDIPTARMAWLTTQARMADSATHHR
jgi:hypothetical protein